MTPRRTKPARAAGGFAPNGIVTLTTDFGTRDAYVGAVKGVLLAARRTLSIHDLAHDVPPQDVAHGAQVLRGACPFFPPGTVHLGVVDPGVGGARAAIVLLAGGHAFVGPDNGLFSAAAGALGGVAGAWAISPTGALARFLPASPAPTFHGRDLFAPTAAAIASGAVAPADVGPPVEPVGLASPAPTRSASGELRGQVTHFDRFGNAATNIAAADAAQLGVAAVVRLPSGAEVRLRGTYADAEPGAALALIGSDGWLEVAVRDGSARDLLRLTPGAAIVLRAAQL